jgi:hypothetical protein
MSKYEALRHHLKQRGAEAIPMTFNEVERIVGFKLPSSQKYPAWWSNNPNNNVMTNEWLAAGYKTEQVDVEGRKLVFRRTTPKDRSESECTPPADSVPKHARRHPLFGWMRGTVTIAPGTDLTEPADPEWGEIAWGERSELHLNRGGRN